MSNISNYQKTVDIPQAIERYLKEQNTNKAELARTAEINASYITHLVKGDTLIGATPIKDKYYEAVCRVINYPIRKEYWRHFDTYYFKRIICKIQEARKEKKRVVIDGDTGKGKSHACREYKKAFPNETFLVTCSAIENSKEFAINIAEVVGVETVGTTGKIIKRVIKKLLSCDNPMLLIDEAEHIKSKNGYINIIKALSDALNQKCGFALLGMGINKILKDGFERNKQNFRQTARRFNDREVLSDSEFSSEAVKICIEMRIENKSIHNYITPRIQNFGDLEELIKHTLKTAKTLDKPVNLEVVKSWFE